MASVSIRTFYMGNNEIKNTSQVLSDLMWLALAK